MKKVFSRVFIVLMLCLGGLTGCSSNSNKKVLRVYNWGEYVDQSVITAFEKEFDCRVVYETFYSNEAMYTKLLAGDQYDVLVPSEYMIERLMREDLIQEIDWSKISNEDSLDDFVLNQDFDPENNFWVPYFYGNVGIVYDKTIVDEKDLEAGWEILINEDYKEQIYMYNSERDSFMVALKALGYSMNSEDEVEMEEAYQWLVEQKNTMNPIYVDDEVIDSMARGEKALAVVYSGDAVAIMGDNEDMEFFLPEEGTNLWFDGFVITKDAKEVDLAHEFINFMISDEMAYKNTTEVGYLTANLNAARKAAENDFEGISAYSVRTDNDKDEIFTYQIPEIKEAYATLWVRLKAQ
jgi:Spermidine/putrescine-binding periplasmic protein